MKEASVIDNLKKVTLEIWKGASKDTIDRSQTPEQINFIFGIDATGLSDFEYLIAGKKAGDEMYFEPDSKALHAMMSHFSCDLKNTLHLPMAGDSLLVKIASVLEPDNREIVSALAGSTSCGSGCDCGCGH